MATYTKLSAEETRQTGFTHKLVVPYTDITGLTSGSAYSVFPKFNAATTQPAGTYVADCLLRVDTAFTFAAGTLTAKVGDGGDDDRFMVASDLKTAQCYGPPNTTVRYAYQAADTIDIIFTCGAGTPATIAAGQFTLFIRMNDVNTL